MMLRASSTVHPAASLDSLMQEITDLPDWDFHNHSVGVMSSQKEQGACDQLVQTRTSQNSRNNSDKSKRRKTQGKLKGM